MPTTPEASPVPDKPPLHLRGGYLVAAPPDDLLGALFAVPAVRALRRGRPNATFAVVTPAGNRPVWERLFGIDQLIVYPDRASAGRIASCIRETEINFESSFVWSETPAAAAFAKLGIQQRFGPAGAKMSGWLTDPISYRVIPAPPGHALREYLWPLQPLGIETFVRANFRPPELPTRPHPPLIALAPDSDFGSSYQWPVERFVEVAETLNQDHDARFLVLNLPGAGLAAGRLAGLLREKLGSAVQDKADELSLDEILTVLPTTSLLIASDGIMAHLAALVGLPAVAIFGPGDIAGRRPQGKMHSVLSAHVECAGCALGDCPLDHRCMNEVSVEMVVGGVRDVLSTGRT